MDVPQKTLCVACLPPNRTDNLSLRIGQRTTGFVKSKCLSPFATIAVATQETLLVIAQSLLDGMLESRLQSTALFRWVAVNKGGDCWQCS